MLPVRISTRPRCSNWIATVATVLVLLLILLLPWQSDAYRIGDAVDTLVQTPSGTTDALRQQMPRFGSNARTVFSESPTIAASHRFSLAFEEGFRQLPWVDMVNSQGRNLERLVVTFVFSKSGGGAIHSVSSQTKYYNDDGNNSNAPGSFRPFRVEYIWREEEAVDLNAGACVMFLATLAAAVVVMLQICGGLDHQHDEHTAASSNTTASSSSSWEEQQHERDALVGQGQSSLNDPSYASYTDHPSGVSAASVPKWE